MRDDVTVILRMVVDKVRLSTLWDKSDVEDADDPITRNVIDVEDVANVRLTVTAGAVSVNCAVAKVFEIAMEEPTDREDAWESEVVCEKDCCMVSCEGLLVAAEADSDIVGVRFACGVLDRVDVPVSEVDPVKSGCDTVTVCIDGVRPTVDEMCPFLRLTDVVTDIPSQLCAAETDHVATSAVWERFAERDPVRCEADGDAGGVRETDPLWLHRGPRCFVEVAEATGAVGDFDDDFVARTPPAVAGSLYVVESL